MATRAFALGKSAARLLPARASHLAHNNIPAALLRYKPRQHKISLSPTTQRSFHSSNALKEKWISSEVILYELKAQNIEKWGWVFYRTTYEDDMAWEIFKENLNRTVPLILAHDPRREINEAMVEKFEPIFIEDKTKFDGASREDLRAHFQEWVADSFSAENPAADQNLLYSDEPVPRYRYFFEIDEVALRSCAPGNSGSGRANFIDGFWASSEHLSGQPNLFTQKRTDKPRTQAQDIEDNPDICWMIMDMAFFMDPHFYASMSGSVNSIWRFLYESPPAVVPTSKLVTTIQIMNMSRRK